ncbi:MAG: DinB family protein [Bacteroidota bacterium]
MLDDPPDHIINTWISELAHCSLERLRIKPPGSWSLGQVYMHLVADTSFYIEQAKACLNSSDHLTEEASPIAQIMFSNNDFPDEIIEGAPSNAYIPQPESKEQLIKELLNLKEEINRVGVLISQTTVSGKTKHPGLGYFSAEEWLQFAGMHFRHHLRQKKRIDAFLKVMDS